MECKQLLTRHRCSSSVASLCMPSRLHAVVQRSIRNSSNSRSPAGACSSPNHISAAVAEHQLLAPGCSPISICPAAPHPQSTLFLVLQMYSESMKDFMVKVIARSGLGQQSTYLPEAINPMFGEEPKNDMATAMLEAKTVMCGAVEDLLSKTGAVRCRAVYA